MAPGGHRAIVASGVDEREGALATLVTAFTSDPFIRWMFPEARTYLTAFPQVLRYFAGAAFEAGTAYRTADFGAVALWLPPGVGPDEERVVAVVSEAVTGERQEEVFGLLEKIGGGHPEQPHWYLPAIGVDPRLQGHGHGSALLARGLEVCDRERQPAYLEATSPRGVPLYRRFGFEVVGELQHGSSPVLTRMLRQPR